MILKNPTNNEVKILIKGELYSVPANGEVMVTGEVGRAWLQIHEFLKVIDGAETQYYTTAKTIETPIIEDEKPKRGRPSKK